MPSMEVSLSSADRPEQQLGAALAAGFGQQIRHVTLHRAGTDNQGSGDGLVATAPLQFLQHPPFGRGEARINWKSRGGSGAHGSPDVTASGFPRLDCSHASQAPG